MQQKSFLRRSLSWATHSSRPVRNEKAHFTWGVVAPSSEDLTWVSNQGDMIFHDFSCGPYLQLRIAVPTDGKAVPINLSAIFVPNLCYTYKPLCQFCAQFMLYL